MQLEKASVDLKNINESFKEGSMTSVAYSLMRSRALLDALRGVVFMHGVELEEPLQIDSNGEVSLIAKNPNGPASIYGSGHFGKDLADLITEYRPRTGQAYGANLSPENGWCKMNHFDVERMVVDFSERNIESRANISVEKPS